MKDWIRTFGLVKMRLLAWSFWGILAIGMVGCESTARATREQEAAIQREKELARKAKELARVQDAEARAWDVFHPLVLEAANYQSSETHGYVGAVFVTERFYPDRMRSTVRRYSIGPYVSVSQVFPDSPAERAGLKEGDRIVSINGKRLPRYDRAARYASVSLKRALREGKPNAFVVRRAGEDVKLSIVAQKAASYSVIVSPDLNTDLRSDGEVIWLSLKLVEDLADPAHFSYACAYSLAQSIMRHPEKRRKNLWIGHAMDLALISTGIPSNGVMGNMTSHSKHKDFELEADLIALYLLSAVGKDVSKYPEFWESQMPKNPYTGAMAPRHVKRLEVQAQIIRSIDKKRARGAFIFPEEYLAGDASEVVLNRFTALVENWSSSDTVR